jgi:hypothetical protein
MDDERRRELLWRLYNPQMPDPFVSIYGVLLRDLPPRRTLRERLRRLAWWRRTAQVEQLDDRG